MDKPSREISRNISEDAISLHRESIVVDLHVDPVIQHSLFGYDLRNEHDSNWKPQKRTWLFRLFLLIARINKLHSPFFNHIDIPRMFRGGYTFGAFGMHTWPRQSEQGWQQIKDQLRYFHQVIKEDKTITIAKNPKDIRTAFAQKKLSAFPAIEGVHCLGGGGSQTRQRRLDRIDELIQKYNVGYLTLAHFSKNDAATPCLGWRANQHEGLTDFGKMLIEKMNETGMIVDLAHVNNRGVLEACQIAKKPVIISHSGLTAINAHPRNISNDMLKAVAEIGGLVGIILATNFLSNSKQNPGSEIVLRHIDEIVQTVGDDHVAIGSDFDGWIPRIPQNMKDACDLPLLTDGMLGMKYSSKRIKKILGENFLRVWHDVLLKH